MKTPLFFIYIALVITLCFWTCQPAPESNNGAGQPPALSTDTPDKKLADEDCRIVLTPRIGDPLSHEIRDTCAIRYIEEYQHYITEVQNTLTMDHPERFRNVGEKLVFGAKVDRAELREMLMKSSHKDPLWIMMGIMPSDSTELIFSMKDSTDTWRYYDFTYPCPTACPDFL